MYIHTDGLGSPVARTDEQGKIISRTRYEPYGATAGGATPTIGFTGHVNDADTGLTYMQQRYYDPIAGRFMSVDPVLTDANTGASFNRYVYANNSPYKYIDPDGRNPAVGAAAAAGAGFILYIGATKYANDPQFRASTNLIFNAVVNLFKAGSTTTAPLLNNGQRPSKTPNTGPPGSIVVNPGSGQEREFGPDGLPVRDVDYDHDHGQGVPHEHEWTRDENNKPVRGPGKPVAPKPPAPKPAEPKPAEPKPEQPKPEAPKTAS